MAQLPRWSAKPYACLNCLCALCRFRGMPTLCKLLFLLVCLVAPGYGSPVSPNDPASLLRPLIDPAKLATLGVRGANSRVQKATAILWQAKNAGQDPATVADQAVALIGWAGQAKGRLTAAAMLRNVTIIERLGCTTPEDYAKMSRGRAPTVRKGPYAGQLLSVDHIIPRAVAGELDNVIANLELMPLALNEGKSDRIGERQVAVAKAFRAAGLLSDDGLRRVLGEALDTRPPS